MLQKTCLNSYHRTDSLLVQFILNDFLRVLEETDKVRELAENETIPQDFLVKIRHYLLKLAGSEQEYVRIFSWIIDSGVLTKLKNTADLLSERAQKNDEDLLLLYTAVYKAWLGCVQSVNLLEEIERGHRNSPEDLIEFKKGIEKTLNAIAKIKPVIKKILPKYQQDENVLFYILRHSASFDSYFGKEWTKKLFTSFQPDGMLEFMTDRFHKRGFFNLIPEITEQHQRVVA